MPPARRFKYQQRPQWKINRCCIIILIATFVLIIILPLIKLLYKSEPIADEIEMDNNNNTLITTEVSIFGTTSITNISEDSMENITIIPQFTNQTTTMTTTQTITSYQTQTSFNNLSIYWNDDSFLNYGKSEFDAALLANGKIIVSGGLLNSSSILEICESYSSWNGWLIGPKLKAYRYLHTLTLFANKTKVLAAGSGSSLYQQTAEVYDSTTDTWTLTPTNMITGRHSHTAVLLNNEQILITGGKNSSSSILSSAELYTPSTNSFTNVDSMQIARYLFTSVLLNDASTVLVAGGGDINNRMTATAELYISGSWVSTVNSMTQGRAYHAAVLLKDGNVLIAGGGNGRSTSYSTAEIYNSTTRTFRSVGSMKYRRGSFTLTLLPSGHVLATGGADWTTSTYPTTCELYDPATQSWSNTRLLNNGRFGHRTVSLNDSVLTIGGHDDENNQSDTCEMYNL